MNDQSSEDEESERSLSPTPSKESNSQFLTVVKSFFTKDSEEFSPSTRFSSMKSSLSPSSQHLPRCKSAINTTLNHLVMVPHGEVKSKLGRAKSAADVPTINNSDFHRSTLFNAETDRRSSLSPMFKRKVNKNDQEICKPAVYWQKPKQSFSQPSSPNVEVLRPLPRREAAKSTQSFTCSIVPPEVKVTSQSQTTIPLSDDENEETVKFMLHDDAK